MVKPKPIENYPQQVLTPKDVSEILGLGMNSVYQLLSTGELPGWRFSRSWRISKKALIEYIETAKDKGAK